MLSRVKREGGDIKAVIYLSHCSLAVVLFANRPAARSPSIV